VLVLSLELLTPAVPRRILSVQMMILGGVFAIVTLRTLVFSRGRGHEHFTLGRFRRRLAVPLFGYLWILFSGWLLRRTPDPTILSVVIGGVILLLVNALSTSWDLLVRVARVRHSDKHAARNAAKPPID